jgi:hypothetical protein
LGDHAQRLALAAPPDHDRDVAADRAGPVDHALHMVVRAGHGGLILGEHRPRDAQRVLEALEALAQGRKLVAECAVLILEPGCPESEDRAPAGEHVERGRLLGQQRRVAVGHPADHQAEVRLRGARRQCGKRDVALEHPVVDRADARNLIQMVHHPDGLEARRLRGRGDAGERVEQVLRSHAGEVEVRDLKPDAHRGGGHGPLR